MVLWFLFPACPSHALTEKGLKQFLEMLQIFDRLEIKTNTIQLQLEYTLRTAPNPINYSDVETSGSAYCLFWEETF